MSNSQITQTTKHRMRRVASRRPTASCQNEDAGFTLVELLITVTIMPLIMGALALGLMAIFSLQSSVAARLGDTGDSQVVSANFTPDVQSALAITTQSSSSPQCGTGNQLLGLAWDLNASSGGYQDVVSYVLVSNGDSANTYSLVRQYCSAGNLTSPTDTTIAYDLTAAQTTPSITCATSSTTCSSYATAWVPTQGVDDVQLGVTEPKSKYTYDVDAVPQASAGAGATGAPITNTTTTNCGYANANSGTYAATLCFVNFAPLNNPSNMSQAENGCLEMSVALGQNYTMYYCLSITGTGVSAVPTDPPTYPEAFMGNSINGVPFYTGVPGNPALYQTGSGTTTVNISNIVIVNPQGVPATGWDATMVDDETTDVNESQIWTSNTNLTVIPNAEPVDSPTDPVGNACDAGAGLTGSGTTTVECNGNGTTSALKTGTPMVEAESPTWMQAVVYGAGLEAVGFGVILS
jgi:prepilin-type N-terminal cleavage/methylation domain-containing protein